MTTTITSDENTVNEPLPPDVSETADETSPEESDAATADDAPPEADDAPSEEDDAPPEEDERDAISLFASSPWQLFLHWSHADDPFETLRKAFAAAAARYRLAVRTIDLTSGEERIHEAAPERSQWLDAKPGRDYRADVGFHADSLPFINVLSSTVVRTPRATVSPRADTEPQFQITVEEFTRVLEATGYEVAAPGESSYDAQTPEESSYDASATQVLTIYQRHCPLGSSENSGRRPVVGGQ